MDETASFIGGHERAPADLVEEGFGIPEGAAQLTYRDSRRGVRVRLIFPTAESARARAAALTRAGRATRREVRIAPLSQEAWK